MHRTPKALCAELTRTGDCISRRLLECVRAASRRFVHVVRDCAQFSNPKRCGPAFFSMWSSFKSKNCLVSSEKTWRISWKRIHAVRPRGCVQNLEWLAASGLPISGPISNAAPAAWARHRVMPWRISTCASWSRSFLETVPNRNSRPIPIQ